MRLFGVPSLGTDGYCAQVSRQCKEMPKEIVDVGSRLAQKEVMYRRLQLSMQVCFAGVGGVCWGMVCVLWRSHGFCQYTQQGYRYPCICLYV